MDHLPHTSPHPLTTVVIPVKDEDPQTVQKLLSALQPYGWPIIVVDDGSHPPLPIATLRLPRSQGYGAALLAGTDTATTDFVAFMDGDGQHRARDVKRLEDFLCEFPHMAMVIGDRRLHERGLRYWGRKGLNWLTTLFAWRWIPDLNSGLRLVRRDVVLGYAPVLCRGFSFTTTLTLSMLADGYVVDWLPVHVDPRRHGTTKVRIWKDGWITLRYIVWIGLALRTRSLRRWLRPCLPWTWKITTMQ